MWTYVILHILLLRMRKDDGGFNFSLVYTIRRDIKQSEAVYCTMADRPSDRLVNEGQLSWTLICVRFDVMTLLNNIIFSFDQRYYYTIV